VTFAVRASLLLVFCLGLIILPGYAQETAGPGNEAAQAFADGDYNTAILIYEDLLQKDPLISGGYYNLGIAYYEAGILGQSLLNLRKAQRVNPRDRDLNAVIATIRSERLDVQGDEQALTDRAVALLQTVLTLRELSMIVFGLWFICSVLAAGAILRRPFRQGVMPILIVGGVAALAATLLWGAVAFVETYRPLVIATEPIVLHSGPAITYPALFDLAPAAEMRMVEEVGEWGRVVLPDGRQGWVLTGDVSFVRIE
jgi:hypothetical protein